jgi:type I restriction enzyme S subunit
MSSEWQKLSIADLCTQVFSGGTPKSTVPAYFDGGSIPWLKTKEVNYNKITRTENFITVLGLQNSSAKLVPINSVIVAMYGNGDTAGRVAINKIALTTNQACCNLVIDSTRADYRFVYYYLQSQYDKLVDLKNGGAQQNLNAKLIKGYPISVPTISEQGEIGVFFEAIDDRIALLRETNATLEAIAQALFKSWFVDFDPVHAKARGEQPEGLSEDLAALFPDSFEESELGLVPRGWRGEAVYSIAEFINGASYKAFEPNTDRRGLPIIKIAELKAGVTAQTAFSDLKMPEKYRIRTGDILFSWSGNPDTSIDTFIWSYDVAWLNQHIFKVVPEGLEERSFVLLALKYLKPMFTELARNKQTTGLGHVTVADLKRLQIVKPLPEILAAWNEIVAPILDQAFVSVQQAQTLGALRDTLLPRLISGQLRLPETEAMVEEVRP